MTNICVYTCVTGGYDAISPPSTIDQRMGYHAWTDNPLAVPPPWQTHRTDFPGLNAKDQNRYAKMHPHLLPALAGYQVSVYVDGSISIVGDVHALVMDSLRAHPEADLFMYAHPFRDCTYEEAIQCARFGHANLITLQRQMRLYRQGGLPAHAGLPECNVLIRRHTPLLASAMHLWWDEYSRYAKRDQLAIMWAVWKSGIRAVSLGDSDPRGAQRVFKLKAHTTPSFSATMTATKWANRALRASGLVRLEEGTR
jgi:hypothetical protein